MQVVDFVIQRDIDMTNQDATMEREIMKDLLI